MMQTLLTKVLKITPANVALSAGFPKKGMMLKHINDDVYKSMMLDYNIKLNQLVDKWATDIKTTTLTNLERFQNEDNVPPESESDSEEPEPVVAEQPKKGILKKRKKVTHVPVEESSGSESELEFDQEPSDEQADDLIQKLKELKRSRKSNMPILKRIQEKNKKKRNVAPH